MKAVIIGNSGSGKTWLSNRIATSPTNIIHLDDIFWTGNEYQEVREEDEIARLVAEALKYDAWIAEGVFGEIAEQFLPDAQALIWLDMPESYCHKRLNERYESIKNTETERQKLLEWSSGYYKRQDSRSQKGHEKLFDEFKGKKHALKSDEDIHKYLLTLQ